MHTTPRDYRRSDLGCLGQEGPRAQEAQDCASKSRRSKRIESGMASRLRILLTDDHEGRVDIVKEAILRGWLHVS
jgi:hypothetical protein